MPALRATREVAAPRFGLHHAVAIGGALYGPADLERLASLPTLDQARAMLLGVLQAPAAKLVRTLAEPPALVARVLAARGKAETVA